MIHTINVTGVRYTPDDLTKRYVRKKIGSLDRYLSRHVRKSATVDIKLKEVNRAHGNKYECDVIMHLPEQTITAKDSTLNMLAAVDIVEDEDARHQARPSRQAPTASFYTSWPAPAPRFMAKPRILDTRSP